MILRGPTGLYSNVIPRLPSDSGSVVYTISSTVPPRSALNFIQIPIGIANKKRSPGRSAIKPLRRSNMGDLIFVSKDNRPDTVSSGNKLFYVGQVIEFSELDQTLIDPINTAIETEHATNYTDGSSIGLNDSEVSSISSKAVEAQRAVLNELESYQKDKDQIEANILSQQKIINEAGRVLSGIDAILAVQDDPDMIKLKEKTEIAKETAKVKVFELINDRNSIPSKIRILHDKLRALAALID